MKNGAGIHQIIEWSALSSKEKEVCLARPQLRSDRTTSETVRQILDQVRLKGDEAVVALTERWDKVFLPRLQVSEAELKVAIQQIDSNVLGAIEIAAKNIRKFHEAQRPSSLRIEIQKGIFCSLENRPIEKVGIYIPAGSAPLISTVLMLAVPAQVAACSEIVLVSPPQASTGRMDASIMATAQLLGINKIYCVGGAQAIGALAYGTETIPKVDKIFGPGNIFVTEAKRQVSGEAGGVAIDIPAGPSEVLVIADSAANPEFVASDLISQAEHDRLSQVLLVSTSKEMAQKVQKALLAQLESLPRREIATKALEASRLVYVADLETAFNVSNAYAPEHLVLQIDEASKYLDRVRNAGSVFVGQWSPEAAGDYASGTNHVLPTSGYSRSMSGVNLASFMKTISFQELTSEGLADLGPSIELLARAEGLDGHRRAISLRLKALKEEKL